ncbi:hypothetical protein D3C85_1900950 [compost metagenome]
MTYLISPLLYLMGGQSQHDQRMGSEHQAGLQQFRYDFAGAGLFQFGQMAVIPGTDQYRHT